MRNLGRHPYIATGGSAITSFLVNNVAAGLSPFSLFVGDRWVWTDMGRNVQKWMIEVPLIIISHHVYTPPFVHMDNRTLFLFVIYSVPSDSKRHGPQKMYMFHKTGWRGAHDPANWNCHSAPRSGGQEPSPTLAKVQRRLMQD